MGELNSKKYHITDEGKVFRVNNDGTYTELGNAEDIQPLPDEESYGTEPPYPEYEHTASHREFEWKWLIGIAAVLIIFAACIWGLGLGSSKSVAFDEMDSAAYMETDPETQAAMDEGDYIASLPGNGENTPLNPDDEESYATETMSEPTDDASPSSENLSGPATFEIAGVHNFGLLFTSGVTALSSAHRYRMDRLVSNLVSDPTSPIEIIGYADSYDGNAEENMTRTEIRVDNIVNYLVRRGISMDRLDRRILTYPSDVYDDYGVVEILVE